MDDGSNVLPFPSRPERNVARRAAPTARETIGSVLRDERSDQERTLADVAQTAGVSLPYLSEVERGRKDVSSELLTSIADALELPMPTVFERVAERLRAGGQSSSNARVQALAA